MPLPRSRIEAPHHDPLLEPLQDERPSEPLKDELRLAAPRL